MNSKQKRIKMQLEQIITDAPDSLRAEVAAEALDCGYDIERFFEDVMRHGCQSGMIRSLIYYHDTHAFYNKHYDEIEAVRHELEESFGETLRPAGDLKNWFAWMAFEETARGVYMDIIC